MSTVSERERKVLDMIETARSKRARFRDPRVTMAHASSSRSRP